MTASVRRAAPFFVALLALSVPARADDPPDAGAGPSDAGVPEVTCIEHVPEGASRPSMKEAFPQRAKSGYAVELRLVITHGKGETVLPEGLRVQASNEATKAFEKAGFVFPDPAGGVAPSMKVEPGQGGTSTTTVVIPIVPLPSKPGRNRMTLPSLPISVGRANNEFITVCTHRHDILVEDPIVNELDPEVKLNPPPRPQREDWPLARNLAAGLPIGAALALLAVWLLLWWRKRPRVVVEPPKPPPWVSALEELERIHKSSLLDDGKAGEYYDRVSDCVRRYLGGRYGFETLEQGYNGLETTTYEMLELLRRVEPPILELARIQAFLEDCDLVKFARVVPTQQTCLDALKAGVAIVRRTIPVVKAAVPLEGKS